MSCKTCEVFFIHRLLCIILYHYSQNKISIWMLKYRVNILVNFHFRLLLKVCIILYYSSYRVLLCDTELASVLHKSLEIRLQYSCDLGLAYVVLYHTQLTKRESYLQKLSCNTSYHHYHSHEQFLLLLQPFSQVRLRQGPSEQRSLVRTGSALIFFPSASPKHGQG